ncbi:RagB/SusD family nutrient uptake outer membrane protein [Sphingobacterium zeae]|uniref:RagB/SusD family nutrient uptake outer membrane protein n=1 Tax=Sphingobacterium zeae TaxID=1776859 RepID=UPI003611C603
MKFMYLILPLVCLTASCGKFLEEYSTDQKYVETTADLKSLMIGEAYINNLTFSIYDQATMGTLTAETGITAPWLHVMDDDSEPFLVDYVATDQLTPFYMLSGFHNWSQEPPRSILNMEWTDVFWRKIYKRIGALNAILFQAASLAEKTPGDDELKHLRGEAYFLRAYYYFCCKIRMVHRIVSPPLLQTKGCP